MWNKFTSALRAVAVCAGSKPTLPVLLVCFSAGIVSVRFVASLPSLFLIALAALVCLIFIWWYKKPLALAVFMLGLCWAGWNAALLQLAMIPLELEKKELVVEGQIISLVTPQERGSSFDFRIERLLNAGVEIADSGKIRLSNYDPQIDFRSGENWRFVVKLKRPRSLVNVGMGFDYAAWLMSKGVTATGYVANGTAERIAVDGMWTSWFNGYVDKIRQGFFRFLGEQETGAGAQAVFAALSVGIRDRMDAPMWRVLRDTGTAHLVAISGLHIGLVALIAGYFSGLLWSATRLLQVLVSRPVARWSCGLLTALAYAVLAGLPLPTQRALAMLMCAALVFALRKMAPPGWLLSIALTVILVISPLAPFASSFWLSFVAVAILVFCLPAATSDTNTGHGLLGGLFFRLRQVLGNWTRMQLVLFIGMLPVLLVGFHQVSLVAPVANLVAVPVIGMVMVPLILLALVAWCCGLLQTAGALIATAVWLFDRIWLFLEWLADLPWSTWQQGSPSALSILIAITCVLILLPGRGLGWRWLAIFWLLPLFFLRVEKLSSGEFRYTILDVGQGLASVVQTQNHVMVFDAGAAYASGFDLGKAVVVPYLRKVRINKIDQLVISHNDNDHIGGAAAVSMALPVEQLLVSNTDSDRLPADAELCRAGQQWTWDGVLFSVLSPYYEHGLRGNNASCVIRVSSQYGSVLLTGDIEQSTERRLLETHSGELLADILQVPHHGSLTSSTPAFIRAVNPQLALVSHGYLNRFGHPHPTVASRYASAEIPLISTAIQGGIEAKFNGSGIHLNAARERAPRFWRASPYPDKRTQQLITRDVLQNTE